MYAILRFLFPDKPYTAGNSWLLLAARIIFGGLLMSHGIAKWQNFDALSASFPIRWVSTAVFRLRWRSSVKSSVLPGLSRGCSTGWLLSR